MTPRGSSKNRRFGESAFETWVLLIRATWYYIPEDNIIRWLLICKRTTPTERPLLVGEVSGTFCG
jgi:hypothetical protein